jgi:ethanolamine permease
LIALCSLGAILYNPDYRRPASTACSWSTSSLVYFALAGRNRLVLSPEEELATTRGERGHPEADEGYGRTTLAEAGEETPPPKTVA